MALKLLPVSRVRLANSLLQCETSLAPVCHRNTLPLTITRGIKYGWSTANLKSKAANFKDTESNLPTLSATPEAALARKAPSLPLRTGALAYKKGMTAIYDPITGVRVPCTVLQFDRVEVIAHKTAPVHGYWAVQVGCDWKHFSNVTRAMLGHFAQAGVSPKRHVAEFKVKDESGLVPIGSSIGPEWFFEGQFVDTRADCKGKGFAGGMKKWGWAGQPASHGNSLNHRTMGSSGGSQGSGSRVIPGKHMPGRMGGQRVTNQNHEVLIVDSEKSILVVKGSVAGPKGSVVHVQDAIFKPWPNVAQLMAAREAKQTAAATETA